MKGFSYYVINAVITQFMKHFDCNVFAETVVNKIHERTGETPTIYESKKSGMILRSKRDSVISDTVIKDSLIAAMLELIENDSDDFEVDLVEKYEFEFNPSQIDTKFIDETMDIKRKGKDIYIEIDI